MTDPCTLENGTECCVYCWIPFGGEENPTQNVPYPGFGAGINYTYGPVVHAETRREYDHVGASPPGSPLAHPTCYNDWAEATNDTDSKLTEWTDVSFRASDDAARDTGAEQADPTDERPHHSPVDTSDSDTERDPDSDSNDITITDDRSYAE